MPPHGLIFQKERLAIDVARRHGVEVDALKGRRKTPTLRRARREWVALVTWTLALSSTEAGELLDLDHTSVLYNLNRREAELRKELSEERRKR